MFVHTQAGCGSVLYSDVSKRQRRNKAAASAKRPKPKLAERKADWHIT